MLVIEEGVQHQHHKLWYLDLIASRISDFSQPACLMLLLGGQAPSIDAWCANYGFSESSIFADCRLKAAGALWRWWEQSSDRTAVRCMSWTRRFWRRACLTYNYINDGFRYV